MKQLKQREKMLIKTTSQRQTEGLSIEKIKNPFHSYQQHHDLNDRHTPDCRTRSYNDTSQSCSTQKTRTGFLCWTALWFSQKLLLKSFRNQTYIKHNHTRYCKHTLVLCTNIPADAMNSNVTCLLCEIFVYTGLTLKRQTMMKKENYSHRGPNTRKMRQRIEGEQLIPHSSRIRVWHTFRVFIDPP